MSRQEKQRELCTGEVTYGERKVEKEKEREQMDQKRKIRLQVTEELRGEKC